MNRSAENKELLITRLTDMMRDNVKDAKPMPNVWAFHKGVLKSDRVAYFQVTVDLNGAWVSDASDNCGVVIGLEKSFLLGKKLEDVPGVKMNDGLNIFGRAQTETVTKYWENDGIKCIGLIFKESYNVYGEYLIRL